MAMKKICRNVCRIKNLAFLCSAKIKRENGIKAAQILVKFSENIWWLEKMIYFCSPKFREG
jgi:hypothetical protein